MAAAPAQTAPAGIREVRERFAEAGIGFAAISYRLSPQVRHPAHVEDCAAAFAWLHANVARHGGDHLGIVVHLAGRDDPVRRTMVEFVQQRCRELDAARERLPR